MSNKLDNIDKKRNKIIIALYFVILFQFLIGVGLNILGKYYAIIDYGFEIVTIILFYLLYKTSRLIGKDKSLRVQYNDERRQSIRTKSMARGFKAMMYTFMFITAVEIPMSLFYNIEIVFGYPELVISYISLGVLCFIGFTTAFVSYFTLEY